MSLKRPALAAAQVGLIVALALCIRLFVVEAFWIPSGSMENTLHIGDRVLVNKLAYDLGSIHRGDIIVFNGRGLYGADGANKDYIKRVIGLPGDVVQCCDPSGRVEVNGTPISEPYIYQDNAQTFGPVRVPAGTVWVMGDHRSDSDDSRDVGPVPISQIVGRADVVVWPFSSARALN